ncbi:MAG: hypothetical protein JKX85_07700 [Phycisphaeraceae bacterium]|nr:hypothetical protein [Phycisphaeraceae bacterium]
MQQILVGIFTLFLLTGCQSSKPLPYSAGEEGASRFIRADYEQIGSKIQVVVDGSAYKIQKGHMLRANGQQVEPLAIQRPPRNESNLSRIGSFNGGHIASGRNTGPTIGVSTAGNAVQTKTYIWFDLVSLGDAPWTLKLDVLGLGEQSIELPAKFHDQAPEITTPTPTVNN